LATSSGLKTSPKILVKIFQRR